MAQHKDMMPYNGPIWQNLMDGFELLLLKKKMPQELGESGGWERLHFFRDIFYKNTGVH